MNSLLLNNPLGPKDAQLLPPLGLVFNTENRCARQRCQKPFTFSKHGGNAARQRFCSAKCQQIEWQRVYGQQWRKSNPTGYRKRMENAVARVKKLIADAKAQPCLDCHKTYPSYVMDFDHVRGEKKFCIGHSAFQQGMKTVRKEIAKCEVVCANCHRERTHQRKCQK